MVCIRHFMLVLFCCPGSQDIRRVYVHENIRIIEPLYYFQCRPVVYLDTPQAFCSLQDNLRQIVPVPESVHTLPTVYIVFPAHPVPICPEPMTLPACSQKVSRSLEIVLLLIRCKRSLILMSGIRRCRNNSGQSVRIIPDTAEQVRYVVVKVIYHFNSARLL